MTQTTTPPSTSEPPPLPTSLEDLVANYPDWEQSPQVKVTCPICEKLHWHNELLASIFPQTPCDPCADTQKGRLDGQAYLDTENDRQRILDALLPPALADTDTDRIPQHMLENAMLFNPNGKKGLWIAGPTLSMKSRTLAIIIKKLHKLNVPIRTFFHGAFTDQLIENVRSSKSLRSWKNKLSNAPIIAIDDLFSHKLSEFAEATVYDVLEARINNYKPTIVTTQSSAKSALANSHAPQRCRGFFARIKDNFTLINSK